MAGNDDCESGCLWLQVKLCQVMQHVNGNAGKFDDSSLREFPSPCTFIDVATNCCEGSNGPQLVENLRVADVAGVNDVFRSSQRLNGFGTKQAVRVGDDADEYGVSQFSVLSSQSVPACAHQLIHFGMRWRAVYARVSSFRLHFLREVAQQSNCGSHRPRTQTDALYSKCFEFGNRWRTRRSKDVHRASQIGDQSPDRLRIANTRDEYTIRTGIAVRS